MFEFDGKVTMVTGAFGNLCQVVARAFRGYGASLALIDRHQDVVRQIFPDMVDAPHCTLAGCADLTDPAEVVKVVEAAKDIHGASIPVYGLI